MVCCRGLQLYAQLHYGEDLELSCSAPEAANLCEDLMKQARLSAAPVPNLRQLQPMPVPAPTPISAPLPAADTLTPVEGLGLLMVSRKSLSLLSPGDSHQACVYCGQAVWHRVACSTLPPSPIPRLAAHKSHTQVRSSTAR